jgi:hypothetical protein
VCVCVRVCVCMTGCITEEPVEEEMDGLDETEVEERLRVFVEEEEEEEEEGLRESDGICYCTSTSTDPDCDYSYYAASDICNIGFLFETEDNYAWIYRGQIENHDSSNSLYVTCGIPANYYNYEGHSSDSVGQVVLYAANRYDGYLDVECDLYSVGMQDSTWQYEDDCEIAADSSSIQRCEMESFSIDWSDPLLVLECEIPPLYDSNWSYIRGFRVCYSL